MLLKLLDKKDPKGKGKDAKKPDPKAKGKVEEVVEEEEIKEDEYDKATEMVYVLTDYPSTKNEFMALGNCKTALNLLMNVEVNWVEETEIKNETMSQGSKVNRSVVNNSQNTEENKDDSQILKEVKEIQDINYSEEDKDYIEECRKLEGYLQAAKVCSKKISGLRDACVQLLNFSVNIRNIEAGYDLFKDAWFKFVCDFSLDMERFENWCKKITVSPLDKEADMLKKLLSKQATTEEAPVEDVKKDAKKGDKKVVTEEEEPLKTKEDLSMAKSDDLKARLGRISYSEFSGMFNKSYNVSAEHTTGATI